MKTVSWSLCNTRHPITCNVIERIKNTINEKLPENQIRYRFCLNNILTLWIIGEEPNKMARYLPDLDNQQMGSQQTMAFSKSI